MFCEECGKKGNAEDVFCEECGTPFAKPEEIINQDEVSTGINSSTKVITSDDTPNIINNVAPVTTPKEPIKLTKSHMVCFGLLCITIGSLAALYNLASEITTPEYIAESYIEAKETSNFDAMKDFFDASLFDDDIKGVYEQASLAVAIDDIELLSNYYGEDYIDYNYRFEYDHNDSTGTGDVSLIKLKSKKWLFFDNWVIDPDYAIISGTTIQMLEDTVATLGSVNIKDIATKTQKSTNGTVIYTLPALLRGNYLLNVDYPFEDSVQYQVVVDYYGINNLKSAVSVETSTLLEERTIETLTDIYLNAANGASFSYLSKKLNLANPSYFNENQFDLKIKNNLAKVDISNYELSDITTTMSTIMYDTISNNYFVTVSLDADAYLDGEFQGTSYFFYTSDPYYDETFGSIRDFTVYYIYEGDDWVISDISLVTPY